MGQGKGIEKLVVLNLPLGVGAPRSNFSRKATAFETQRRKMALVKQTWDCRGNETEGKMAFAKQGKNRITYRRVQAVTR